jgi:DNA-binding NarL/FixJ family response regulator
MTESADIDGLLEQLPALSSTERGIIQRILASERERRPTVLRMRAALSDKPGESSFAFDRLLEAPFSLTPRELDVLKLIFSGKANKEAALELGISPRTVESHRARIMERLGVDNLAQLIGLVWRLTATD